MATSCRVTGLALDGEMATGGRFTGLALDGEIGISAQFTGGVTGIVLEGEINHCTVLKIAGELLHKPKDMSLSLYESGKELAIRFNKFFLAKIVDIRNELKDIKSVVPVENIISTSNPPPFLSLILLHLKKYRK